MSTTCAPVARTRSAGARCTFTPRAPPPIATTSRPSIDGVRDHRPRPPGAERRDRAADVARLGLRLLLGGEREAVRAQQRAQGRPVEPATAGDEDEEEVVRRATDEDRAQEAADRDALERGALLGAAGDLRPDDAERDAGGLEGGDGRGAGELRAGRSSAQGSAARLPGVAPQRLRARRGVVLILGCAGRTGTSPWRHEAAGARGDRRRPGRGGGAGGTDRGAGAGPVARARGQPRGLPATRPSVRDAHPRRVRR